jgi:PIN domain nuclease of toxin-antitoxin system
LSSLGLLLDTCAIIFLAEKHFISEATIGHVDEAGENGVLYISPISAWEIGRGVAKGKMAVAAEPLNFFTQFMENATAKLCDMGPDILVASSFLPGPIHKDPFDRILVETARRLDLTLVTSDRAILAYGALGHVKTLAC